MTPISLEPNHPASRLGGLQQIKLDGATLTLTANSSGTALLVIRAGAPLRIRSVTNATAVLKPGWEGSLGYGLYGLELPIKQPGLVRVILEVVPPNRPSAATADAELVAFRAALAQRPSRFPNDAQDFQHWQRTYREKLAGWLMNGQLPRRVPLEARVMAGEDRDGFTLETIEYRSLADRTNTALLALPRSHTPVPLLLALHGHEAEWGQADRGAFTLGHNDDFCAWFASHGWAVLQPATMNHSRQHPDWTLLGEWTWDAIAALDYAATVPGIDPARIAVCGLSTGGHLAMNILALDDRVRAGIVGCVLSTWNHYARRMRIPPHCDCGALAQLASRLEQCDWAALAAPKPVQFQHGKRDACFCPGADEKDLDPAWNTGVMPPTEFAAVFAEVERAWRLAGAAGQASVRYHEAGHRIDNAAALAFLTRQIGQPAAPSSRRRR